MNSAPSNAALSDPPAPAAALLQVRNIAKNFGSLQVLKNISLDISSGEFLTLLGESGSGKPPLLRLIAGFEQPNAVMTVDIMPTLASVDLVVAAISIA